MTDIAKDAADDFIAKWKGISASELSTAQSFLSDLCRLLGVELPHPDAEQQYMFERPITFTHGDGSTSAGRIDLYKRGAFVLEAKKLKSPKTVKGFDDAMLRARSQAEAYARALPAGEGRPPFVVVVDVGRVIELYSEFSRSGATYTPFPDPRSHRIALDELRDKNIRDRLLTLWLDPLILDPSRESARVTRQIAAQLAELAKSLERAEHSPETVAQFLMRCLFTMFAEDVMLLPADSFLNLLKRYKDQPDVAMRMLRALWQNMDSGGFSSAIASDVLRFNGKLFKTPDILPLTHEQIALLIKAAEKKWEHVEPAIFGTLLERALSPADRHKLGAHFTPRAYVERLVLPTVIEPLRSEWSDAHAAALTLAAEGKRDEAVAALRAFHHRLCNVRVLDPACGSGNFLYVTLEHLKRLEGEVFNALDELGFSQPDLAINSERADALGGETVDPHQLLGIELNPRAAAIAEVVLWIGYLQWHYRTRGDVNPPQPVIRDFRNIENRDAVLAYDKVEYVSGERGVPVTRWDGRTMKVSPITGEEIPDETARVPLERYVNPRKAAWPQADFVVGNPPYLGARRIRMALGDGYLDALRGAYPEIPEHVDFVMYWWARAAELAGKGLLQRFGLITSNSIRQSFSRKVLDAAFEEFTQLSFRYVVPDHPWVDTADGAAVRVAMTVVGTGKQPGRLQNVIGEHEGIEGEIDVELGSASGKITPNLTIGVDPNSAVALLSNRGMACVGYQLSGQGFVLDKAQAETLSSGLESAPIRSLLTGRDITQSPRSLYAIDLYGLTEEQVRATYAAIYQWVLERVKPERNQNNRQSLRERWWIFGEARSTFRPALSSLKTAIATSLTAKHRAFIRVPAQTICDSTTVMFAFDDAFAFGVLSSCVHVTWSLSSGGTLEDRPRYNKSLCFETFPFPTATEQQRARIRELAEQLDAHRKRQQAAHPDLTLTGMYNVLEKLRSGEPLTTKERTIHEHGLVSVLRQLHDELDAAALDAYGWSDLLPLLRAAHNPVVRPERSAEGAESKGIASRASTSPAAQATLNTNGDAGRENAKRAFDEAILERLVALNAERVAEEARGLVRWLRPKFQHPGAETKPQQAEIETLDETETAASALIAASKPRPWPKDAIEQVRAVTDVLAIGLTPLSLEDIAARFTARGSWKKRLPALLDMLVALGRAREAEGRYSAS